jgi:hypothetical protein
MAPSLTRVRKVLGPPVFTSVVIYISGFTKTLLQFWTTSATRMKMTRMMYFKFPRLRSSSHPEKTDGERYYLSSVYFAITWSQLSPAEHWGCLDYFSEQALTSWQHYREVFLTHLTMKNISKSEVSGHISYNILDSFFDKKKSHYEEMSVHFLPFRIFKEYIYFFLSKCYQKGEFPEFKKWRHAIIANWF